MMFKIFLAAQVALESLPISSSGHLVLLWYALHRLGFDDGTFPFSQNVDYLMHAPTLAVVCLYCAPLVYGMYKQYGITLQAVFSYGSTLFCATACTLLFFLAKKYGYFPQMPLWFGFAITMVLLLSSPRLSTGRDIITYSDALIVGCVQGCALLPGISRLASTYSVARLLGISHMTAFLFVCAMQVPLFAGAASLGIYNLWKVGTLNLYITPGNVMVSFGASVVAYILLWITELCMKHGFLYVLGMYMSIPLFVAFFSGL